VALQFQIPRVLARKRNSASTPLAAALCLLGFLSVLCGCDRLRPHHREIVYVSNQQVYLHDRVAAISSRVAQAVNGQQLVVLEHGRRFLKVKTGQNQIGWVEEHSVIDQKTYDAFTQLAAQHKDDPAAATATLRDVLYMHISPGRETVHFYLLPGNCKVELLERASVVRAPQPGSAALAVLAKPASSPTEKKPPQPKSAGTAEPQSPPPPPPPPPAMEDWWLARDSQGHTGWLLGNRVDVDVPDEIEQYGEGQRFIGAWLLKKVNDPDASTPDHEVPEYLTVMGPNHSGESFDYDQVRVFTWDLKRHRYGTAFRLHPIQGFLPVRIGTQNTPQGTVPAFSFEIASGPNTTTDPATGITRPVSPRTIRYELVDTRVVRIGPDLAPIVIPTDQNADSKAKNNKDKKTAHKKHK
jgi:hypothetical protein